MRSHYPAKRTILNWVEPEGQNQMVLCAASGQEVFNLVFSNEDALIIALLILDYMKDWPELGSFPATASFIDPEVFTAIKSKTKTIRQVPRTIPDPLYIRLRDPAFRMEYLGY
ncbi:hypothetical protein [Oceanospirillum sediminis]|uniref:Uncharacterized protein n=1 Tax=Oceanospirillum sediminis TaxID=2760088 RepID=A0A839IM86_9GAMM|nr:hypothetical protein [Oceanospirillum sediminis]MBB1485814.1 hypothetical protein [Oceanospirillum sediminis]